MQAAIREFYNRYYLLTGVMPAAVMALLFYGTAWLFGPDSPLFAGDASRIPFIGSGLLVLVGMSRLLASLGFLLSGVPRARIEPGLSQLASLKLALPPGWPYDTALLDLGDVPFLAAGGGLRPTVWLSTYTLDSTDAPVLRALIAHETAHLRQSAGFAWFDLTWLAAYPIAWLLHLWHLPVLLLGFAALHLSGWLHLMYWLKLRSERHADKAAAEELGVEEYASALAEHLRQYEVTKPNGSTGTELRRLRLTNMGLDKMTAARVIEASDSAPRD